MYRKIILPSLATVLALFFSGSAMAEKTLIDCAKIDDVTQRVQCYDKLAGRVQKKLDDKSSYTGTTRQRTQQQKETVIKEVIGDVKEDPAINQVTVRAVTYDRNRRPIYATTDGRFFKRTASKPVSFRKGDKLTLKEGMLGSLFLVRDDGLRIKVKELQ